MKGTVYFMVGNSIVRRPTCCQYIAIVLLYCPFTSLFGRKEAGKAVFGMFAR